MRVLRFAALVSALNHSSSGSLVCDSNVSNVLQSEQQGHEGDASILLQSKKSAMPLTMGQPVAGDHEAMISSDWAQSENDVLSILAFAFADVPNDNARPQLTIPLSPDHHLQCLGADVTQRKSDDPGLLPAIYEAIGIVDNCSGGGEVCMAISAARQAMIDLEEKFPAGPKMVNLTLVDFGSKAGETTRIVFQSWRAGTVDATPRMVTLPLDTSPPLRNFSIPAVQLGEKAPFHATVLDGNGNNAYILCEFSRSIVQQTFHQEQTNSCGWTAVLEGLAEHSPALAFKTALRTLWIGRPSSLVPMPCPQAYEQQPGLRPIGWIFGIEAMWVISLMSSYRRASGLSCSAPELLGYLTSVDAQSTYPAALIWMAENVMTPLGRAELLLNRDTCPGDVGACLRFSRLNLVTYGADEKSFNQAKEVGTKASGVLNNTVNRVEIERMAPYLGFTMEQFKKAPAHSPLFDRFNFPSTLGSARSMPSFTKDLLDRACQSLASNNPVIFMVNDAILEENYARNQVVETETGGLALRNGRLPRTITRQDHQPKTNFQGACNHWTVLDSCDATNQLYRLWSWGAYFYITEAEILGQTVSTESVNATLPASQKFSMPLPGEPFNTGMVCLAITIPF